MFSESYCDPQLRADNVTLTFEHGQFPSQYLRRYVNFNEMPLSYKPVSHNRAHILQNIIVLYFIMYGLTSIPEEKAIPRHVLKPVIATMSSMLPAAINKVGTPFSTPYPPACKISIEGTTTAGETAPRTKLKTHRFGISKRKHWTKKNFRMFWP